MKTAIVVAMLALLTAPLSAQNAGLETTFVELRQDGNGIAALRQMIRPPFTRGSAESALLGIAAAARLNVTIDVAAAGRSTIVVLAAESRSVAGMLLDVATQAHLRIRVSSVGQLIVDVAPPAVSHAAPPMPERGPITLPVVRAEAERIERQRFESSPDVGALSIAGAALRASPVFVEPDVLRSIQLMPGIEARSDYSAGFNVRGGEGDQNLVLLDGYPIYNPYHLGGVFSTFIDPTVGRVELYRGVPVRFGGRLSGVLDVRSAEPTRTDLGGTAEVSLVSSTMSLSKAFDDGNGGWTVAGRRTYADVVFGLVRPNSFPYHFQDAQAHGVRSIAGWRLSATAYDGLDASKNTPGNDTRVRWGNGVLGLTLSRQFDGAHTGDSVVVEQRASLTRFDARIDIRDLVFSARDRVNDARIGGSLARHTPRTSTTVGYEVSRARLSYVASSPFNPFSDFLPFDSVSQQSRAAGVFLDALWRPRATLLLEGGTRVDQVDAGGGTSVSPRVSLKYFAGPNVALTAALGWNSQWLHSLGREEEPVQPLQFWLASDSLRPVSRVRDAVVGLERWWNPRQLVHVELFHKQYSNILVPNVYNDPSVAGDEFAAVRGTSYGADVLLRQLDGGPFSGWVAYTYAVSSRLRGDGLRYFPSQDRRHNVNVVGSWHLGSNVVSARANLASGLPFTPTIGDFIRERYDLATHRWVPDETSSSTNQAILGPLNSDRFPWYERVDVSISHTGTVHGARVAPYLSIVNVFNSHNPAAYLYEFSQFAGGSRRTSFPNLPFAPTFGVNIVF